MDYVLEHFKHCCSYSIDTESDCDTYDIALIQIHSIPVELPAIVVLIELNHLPSIDSLLFSQIRLLFDFVFQSRNIIYSWGRLVVELEPALSYDIFIFPLGGELINLQRRFKTWIEEKFFPCVECKFICINPCCSQCNHFPHLGSNETWSLQDSLIYTCGQFLDKAPTKNYWSLLLDPLYSTISSSTLSIMIRYATYDCLAVSYLHRPVLENWCLQELKQSRICLLLTNPPSIMFDELEDISDDDIHLNRLEDISDDEIHLSQLKDILPDAIPFNQLESKFVLRDTNQST
ncbi:unnamed protein product [Rotaria magnacalcarata]|uniref:Uncharacterized protein n=1 Tax=Rotaria magnacalcarata TaxID=392030 RepID=A0A816REP6_9BILA|nr:unnamed protein product [Rotaria magnacalcarata]